MHPVSPDLPCQTVLILRLLRLLFVSFVRSFSSRRDLLLENLALRQQLAVLKMRCPQPRFKTPDRIFWIIMSRLWPGWEQCLILLQPEMVVRWRRAGFKLYWKWILRHRVAVGRKCVSGELRESHLSHGGGEPDMGSATDSSRTEDAWFRHL